MLTISGYGEGKCVWCCLQGEGVQARFADGLTGFFCKKHMWDALKARSESGDKKEDKNAATK